MQRPSSLSSTPSGQRLSPPLACRDLEDEQVLVGTVGTTHPLLIWMCEHQGHQTLTLTGRTRNKVCNVVRGLSQREWLLTGITLILFAFSSGLLCTQVTFLRRSTIFHSVSITSLLSTLLHLNSWPISPEMEIYILVSTWASSCQKRRLRDHGSSSGTTMHVFYDEDKCSAVSPVLPGWSEYCSVLLVS